ncbi:MAG: DegT/DnrJ/EryC1/StrS family aminotransferase [Halobacteria archaeon]
MPKPSSVPVIPVSKPTLGAEELEEVRRVLESGWVSDGPAVRKFEEAFGRYIGVKHCVALSSATAALHLTWLALGVGPRDEVLVPDFTFPATGHSVFYVGARPRLVDIDLKTLNMDVEDARKKVRKNAKVVVPVHMAGNPVDLDALRELAEEEELILVEDAAQAHGTEFRGRKAGTFGRAAIFSFHGRKLITTGEGGAVVTDDGRLADRIRMLRSHGMTVHAWKRFTSVKHAVPTFEERGFNFRMSDIQAAVGIAQVRRLGSIIRRRREIARLYREGLSRLKNAVLPEEEPGGKHVYMAFPLLLKRGVSRGGLMARLREDGVGTALVSYAQCVQPTFRELRQACPRSVHAFRHALAIPMFDGLTDAQVGHVVERVRATIG